MKKFLALVFVICFCVIAAPGEESTGDVENQTQVLFPTHPAPVHPPTTMPQRCNVYARFGGNYLNSCPFGYYVNDVRINSFNPNNFMVWVSCYYYEVTCN